MKKIRFCFLFFATLLFSITSAWAQEKKGKDKDMESDTVIVNAGSDNGKQADEKNQNCWIKVVNNTEKAIDVFINDEYLITVGSWDSKRMEVALDEYVLTAKEVGGDKTWGPITVDDVEFIWVVKD